jgi:oligopeptide transport system substrate-binding protein
MISPYIYTLLLLFLCGCKPLPPADTLRVGIGAPPATLDPHMATGIGEMRVISALYDGLCAPDGKGVRPAAAESWEISPDGRIITFTLRADARWSDGSALTAEDFVWSLRRALSPTLGATNAALADSILGARDYREGRSQSLGIEALSPRQIRYTLVSPDPLFLQKLTHPFFYPVHRPTVEAAGDPYLPVANWSHAGSLLSNGAFCLSESRTYRYLAVERNSYSHSPARLRRIEFYPIENRSSEEIAYLSGTLDITMSLPLNKVAAYRSRADLRIDPALQVEYILVNTTRPPLDQKAVRQALSLALDRRALCEHLLRGGQRPALRLVPPEVAGGYDLSNELTESIAQARSKLAHAGVPPQTLAELSYLFNTSEARKAIAEGLQGQWQQALGSAPELTNMEWKSYLSQRQKGAYDLARAGWVADINDAGDFLRLFVSDNPNNSTGWKNASYDAAVAAGNFAKAEAILMEELPLIPLYFNPNVYLCSPRVSGWAPGLMDRQDWRTVGVK